MEYLLEDTDYDLEDPIEARVADDWVTCSACGAFGRNEVEILGWSVAQGVLRFRCPGCNDIQESRLYE